MTSELPPGPRGPLPPLRYAWSSFDYQREAARRFGPAFTLRFRGRPFVLFASVEGAREVLSLGDADTRACAVPFGNDAVKPAFGEQSVFLSAGERHAEDRRMLGKGLGAGGMAEMSGVMRDICEEALEACDGVVPLDGLCRRVAARNILAAVLGPGPDVREIAERVLSAADAVPIRILLAPGLYQGLPWAPAPQRFYRAQVGLVGSIRRQLASRPGGLSAQWAHPDEGGRPGFDLEERVQQALAFVGPGTEGVGALIARALVCAWEHPALLASLRAEVEAHGAASPLLRGVLSEVLRRYPIVTEVFRELVDARRIGGFDLPAGAAIGVAIAAVHTQPDIWDEPLAFRPERFAQGRPAPFSFLPFGGAPRRCIGATLTVQLAAAAVATLLGRVEPVDCAFPVPMRRRNVTTSVPGTITVRVRPAAA